VGREEGKKVRMLGQPVTRDAVDLRLWRGAFAPLERLGVPVAGRAVVCLCPELLPIDEQTWAVPVGAL